MGNMSKLMDFLENRSKNDEKEKKIIFSADTEEMATITKVTPLAQAHYQKRAMSLENQSFDTGRYQMDLIINHTIDPNFKDAEILKKSGFAKPEDLVNALLSAGEAQELASEISKFSGLDKSIKDLKKEAKN